MTINMNETIKGVTLTKVCSMKPDKDSTESKQVTVQVTYDGLPLSAVFAKALRGDVIQFQNGSGGRKNYDNLKDGQVIKLNAKSPGATQVDPETAMKAKLAGMPKDERKAYLEGLLAEAK